MKKEKLEFSIPGFPFKKAIFNKSQKESAQRWGPLACRSVRNGYENSVEWQSSTRRQIIQTPVSGQTIFHLFNPGIFCFQLRFCFRGYQNSIAHFQRSVWLTSSLTTMGGLWQPPRSLPGTRASSPLGQKDTIMQCGCAACFPVGKEAILDPKLSGWCLMHLSASITVP